MHSFEDDDGAVISRFFCRGGKYITIHLTVNFVNIKSFTEDKNNSLSFSLIIEQRLIIKLTSTNNINIKLQKIFFLYLYHAKYLYTCIADINKD